MPGDSSTGEVIFRPFADRANSNVSRRFFAPLAMTDYGDRVEWTDGKRTTAMRLPDQRDSGAGYPVLHTVLIADYSTGVSYAPHQAKEHRIRFLGSDGAVLAWLGPRPAISADLSRRILPEPEAYEPLIGRGVQVVHESYTSEGAFLDAHPDPRVAGFADVFARHGFAITFFGLLAVVIVVLAVMAAGGAFSSS